MLGIFSSFVFLTLLPIIDGTIFSYNGSRYSSSWPISHTLIAVASIVISTSFLGIQGPDYVFNSIASHALTTARSTDSTLTVRGLYLLILTALRTQ